MFFGAGIIPKTFEYVYQEMSFIVFAKKDCLVSPLL